jgi:hypothetical protein
MRGTVAGEGPARQMPMSTGEADSHVVFGVRLGCHKQKFQVPRLARNIHFSAVKGRKMNVSSVPPWDTEHAWVPLPVAGGGSSIIKKDYKGHSPEPPTLVVKCKETLSRDVTLLRSDAFKKISCGAGLFKMQRFETFAASCFRGRVLARHITSPWRSCSVRAHKTAMVCNVLTPVRWGLSA